MKTKLLAGMLIFACATSPLALAAELDTLEQKANYWLGLKVGATLHRLDYKLDTDAIRLGVEDSLKLEGGTHLTAEQLEEATNQIKARVAEIDAANAAAEAEENKKLGVEFLAENAKKEGVITTASGLQYKIIKAGSGPKPTATDIVKVHYQGALVDGTLFDSSYARNEPATFPLDGVIDGWTEGLQLVPVGTSLMLFVPPELGYGEFDRGQIGANSTLIFDIELLEINPSEEEATEEQAAEPAQ